VIGLAAAATLLASTGAAENRIDVVRPDAPSLAGYGEHAIGVRTVRVVNRDQIDIVNAEAIPGEGDGNLPRYDRPLTLEIWYPAIPGGEATPYESFLPDGETPVELLGRATRGADADRSGAPYPLVLVSHGYPGDRFLMSHLAESLASRGYVVASIDHTDSTYRTRAAFASTLVNRPLDQLFVLEEMARMGSQERHFLRGLVDADATGLIGYSMGGYGAVITAGGGVTKEAVEGGLRRGGRGSMLGIHLAGSEEHEGRFDDRVKAVVAIAPWGMKAGFWDAEGLAGVRVPTLFVAGSVDDISGYEGGVKAIFEQTRSIERILLTFENANHNAAAPIPAPAEASVASEGSKASFSHFADAVWDNVRMNNIAQHFVTAWLGRLLKGDSRMEPCLDLVPRSGEGIWAVEEDGTPKPEHTYWEGFENRTAAGLRWEKLAPSPPRP
jgi:predicted dienelactone hydrolase